PSPSSLNEWLASGTRRTTRTRTTARTMRILLLNQAFHPDVVSSGQHLTDLALALVARGHAVTVVTSRRAYDDPKVRFARRERWNGIEIIRTGSTGLGKG